MAILFAMAGAPSKMTASGKRQRGEIHVLVASDPGMAKSALLEGLDQYAPRVVHVDGTGASGAGVAAAVEHDSIDKSWVLRAGALVQADDGICAFDELGYLDPDDRGHMNTAMESGYVLQTKVVKAKLRACATVVGAMNPTVGERFDRYGPAPIAQLGLPSALLSRFDLIFCFLDTVNAEADLAIAQAVLQPALQGEPKDLHGLVLSADEFRRYIAWIRRIDPVLGQDAADMLAEEYVRIRKQDSEHAGFTPRQVQALRRMTLASARLRNSDTADAGDAERAIQLMHKALLSGGIIDAAGKLDGDLLQFGVSRDQNERQRVLLQLIKDLCRAHPDGYLRGHASEEDLVRRAGEQGISEEDVHRGLKQMTDRNTIYARGGAGRWAPLSS